MELILLISLLIVCAITILGGINYKYISSQNNAMQIKLKLRQDKIKQLQYLLTEKVHKKIELTQQSRDLTQSINEYISNYTYSPENMKELEEELQSIFSTEQAMLTERYPQLSNLDLLTITLLGIGFTNNDICKIINMERRTLYKRRQLTAQRIGISAKDLETFAQKALSYNF